MGPSPSEITVDDLFWKCERLKARVQKLEQAIEKLSKAKGRTKRRHSK